MTGQCIDDHTGTTLCLGIELCSDEDDARRSRHEWMMVRPSPGGSGMGDH